MGGVKRQVYVSYKSINSKHTTANNKVVCFLMPDWNSISDRGINIKEIGGTEFVKDFSQKID